MNIGATHDTKQTSLGNIKDHGVPPLWLSSRLCIVVLGCGGFITSYVMRVNINVAIVCMVNHTIVQTNSLNNTMDAECLGENFDGTSNTNGELFNWDTRIQGYILGAYYWGYLVSLIPSGWITTRFGARRVLGSCMLLSTVVTLCCPLAARTSYIFLVVLRIMLGLLGGPLFPSTQILLSKWAPPLERSKLSAIIYSGFCLGLIITYPVGGALCKYGFAGGWPSLFYLCGITSFVWSVIWLLFVSDKPDDHRRITHEEKEYINASLADGTHFKSRKKMEVPWLKIGTSLPNYAIMVANLCCDWGVYTFVTYIPTYLNDVLKLDITSNGVLSAVPYLLMLIVTYISGWLADLCQQKRLLSRTVTRKVFTTIGSIIPALALLGIGFLDCSSIVMAVLLTSLAISMQAFQFSGGFYASPVDIAPHYAGILSGMSTCFGSIPGFILPAVVGEITSEAQTRVEWQKVFYVSATILTFGALFFIIFASGEIQVWAMEHISLDITVQIQTSAKESNTVATNGGEIQTSAKKSNSSDITKCQILTGTQKSDSVEINCGEKQKLEKQRNSVEINTVEIKTLRNGANPSQINSVDIQTYM